MLPNAVVRMLEELELTPDVVMVSTRSDVELKRHQGHQPRACADAPQDAPRMEALDEGAYWCNACDWSEVLVGPGGGTGLARSSAWVKAMLASVARCVDGVPGSLADLEHALEGVLGVAPVLGLMDARFGDRTALRERVRRRLTGDLLEWLHQELVEAEVAALEAAVSVWGKTGQGAAERIAREGLEEAAKVLREPCWVLVDARAMRRGKADAITTLISEEFELKSFVMVPSGVLRWLDGTEERLAHCEVVVLGDALTDAELEVVQALYDTSATSPCATLSGTLDVMRAL